MIIVWQLAGKTSTGTALEFGLKRSFVLPRYCGIEGIRPRRSRLFELLLKFHTKLC
jgi:hypothetical protein